MPDDDRPGALQDFKSSPNPADSGGLLVVPSLKPEPTKEISGVSETVRENVRTPAEVATQRAAQSGTTLPVEPSAGPGSDSPGGQYMTLGAVVVTVNGNPIYANKVLSDIAPVLAVKARELEGEQFAAAARDEVQKQVNVLVRTELEFAAAQRNLDEHDRKLADQLTMQWRQEQVTLAGGSIEAARSRAKADGRDFEDMVQEQYRVEMSRIYYQKKEFPKVQVTADEMRQFYAAHENQLFSERAKARFSIIKISIDASGGRDAALAKITALRDRIIKGESFAQIAGTVNDDEMLLANKGDVGMGDWIDRGAFANEKVESEVWKLQPGQVTPVIEEPTAFFLARMDQRKEGSSRKFDDPAVQALIRRSLEAEQFEALRGKAQADLLREAIVNPDPPQYQPAVDMAMQMYPVWRRHA